jgi:hypothetical protein
MVVGNNRRFRFVIMKLILHEEGYKKGKLDYD